MKSLRNTFAWLTLSIALLSRSPASAVDLGAIEKELASSGVVGWIHGAIDGRDLFVFTYRNPNDFFDAMQFSLIAANDSVKASMKSLKRHDRVRVKGIILANPSPQKHIEVISLELVKKYDPAERADDYQHDAKIPDELLGLTNANFLVHAIAGDGHVLVVEYKDAVLPVFVRNPLLTKDLYRNDVVNLKFTIQSFPDRPTHVRLREKEADPVRVIDAVKDLHGKPGSIEGALVMFPKSPDIVFNVFAVQELLPDGLKRQYTLVNFDDADAFGRIRRRLQEAWDRHPGQFVNGRNKLVSLKIRVRATGIFNEVDPNQANPQILLKDADAIEIFEN